MIDSIYDIPFPQQQKELLLELIQQARKHHVLSVHYGPHPDADGIYHLTFYCVLEDRLGRDWPEDPVPGFEALGLIKMTRQSTFFLTPKAFKWADYEKKNRILKWWVRLPDRIKEFMIVFSFVVSLILVLLQIWEKIRP